MKISRLIYSSSCHKNQPFRPFACYFCWRRFQNAKDRPRHWEGQSNDAHEVANHREAPQDPLGDIDLHLFRQNRGWIFRKWTNYDLVGGWPTPLKNIRSSVGMMTFPIEWKVIKFMFQTTNQMIKKKTHRLYRKILGCVNLACVNLSYNLSISIARGWKTPFVAHHRSASCALRKKSPGDPDPGV